MSSKNGTERRRMKAHLRRARRQYERIARHTTAVGAKTPGTKRRALTVVERQLMAKGTKVRT